MRRTQLTESTRLGDTGPIALARSIAGDDPERKEKIAGEAGSVGELATEVHDDEFDLELLPDHIWVRCEDRPAIQRKLRISLVDRCNLSCFFCHNEGQGEVKRRSNISLGITAVETIVRAAVCEGVNNIKLTGGEPLFYRNSSSSVIDLIHRLAELRRPTRLFDLSMTTNGTLLPSMATQLAAAGLDRVTISLTTTNFATFTEFISTKTHLLTRILASVDDAQAAGLRPVKLNVPLYYSPGQQAGNLYELDRIIGFAASHGVSEVRFFTLLSHANFPSFGQYYHFFSPDMRTALIRCLVHYGWDSPVDTVEMLARLGSKFASRQYPKVAFGFNVGQVRIGFEAMKHGRLGSAPGQQEGPYAMRLGADGSLRTVLGGPPNYLLINAVKSGVSTIRLREIYRAAQEEMP